MKQSYVIGYIKLYYRASRTSHVENDRFIMSLPERGRKFILALILL